MKNSRKIDRETQAVIAVLGPRYKGNYNIVMPAVIRAIDTAESLTDESKTKFVFLHDGVTSGSTGEVIGVVNTIQTSMLRRGREVAGLMVPLDIEKYGKQSHYRWIDQIIELEPDLFVLFDNGEWPQVDYAQRKAKAAGIELTIVRIGKEK